MPYLGWASMGGTDIVNSSRVAAYARGITVMCTCPDLPAALGDEQYDHPARDPAPWYDTAIPESGDFWGVLGLEITGASSSTLSTPYMERVQGGAVGGAPKRGPREVEFKVMLLARTEAALSYGMSWLAAALRGAACQPGCGGDNLCLLAGCPEPPEISAADPADCGPDASGDPVRSVPSGDDGPARADGRDTDDEDGESEQDASERMPNRRKPKEKDEQGQPEGGAAKPVREEKPPPPQKPKPEPKPKQEQGAPTFPPAGDGPPPTSEKGNPDPAVMDTVWLVGHHRQVPPKVMLAAFETVLVESNGRNLDHGDRDSVGAFQQRPSAGWGTPQQCMNVKYAANQFFDRAVKRDQENPQFSAGQLAQKVQQSAYPDRYDKREGDARAELDGAKQRTAQTPQPDPQPDPPPKPPPEPEPSPDPPPQPSPDEGSGNESPAPQPDPNPGRPGGNNNQDGDQGDEHGNDQGDPGEWDPYATATRYLRHAYDVALLEYGDDLEMARANGAHTATVTFTLQAGNPSFYTEPTTLVDTRKRDHRAPAKRDTIPDYRIDQLATCPPPVDCLAQSPYLQGKGPWGDEPFPGSNPRDPNFQDPGYPTQPFTARRAIYDSPGDLTPEWFEKVPIIQVHSGGRDMHRVTVRFHANPRSQPLGDELDPCDMCGEITLPWIPAKTKVTLDGRTQSVDVQCADGSQISSDVQLYGPNGGLLQWPAFDCGMPLFVEVIAQDGTVAADAWYRISWSARTDAV